MSLCAYIKIRCIDMYSRICVYFQKIKHASFHVSFTSTSIFPSHPSRIEIGCFSYHNMVF